MADKNKVMTGIRMDASILDKMKYISWHDRRTFTAVLELAAEQYVDKFEKTNGPITDKQLKEAELK